MNDLDNPGLDGHDPDVIRTPRVREGRLGRAFRPGVGTVAAVTVIGLLLLAAISLRSPGTGRPQVTGPVVATDAQGPFELTIRSSSGTYSPNEAIDVAAELRFRGPDASIDVSGDGGATDGSLIKFGVLESISGNLKLSPVSDLMCMSSTLTRDSPLEEPFAKTGAFSDAGPLQSSYEAYFNDPVLRLPAGIWHIYAVADLGIAQDCRNETVKLRASIAIVIPDTSGRVPTQPPAAPTMAPLDRPVGDDTQEGPIQLTLTSPHGRWNAGDPIEVVAGLTNGGSDGSITTYGPNSGPVAFSLRQMDGPIVIDSIVSADCSRQITLPLYKPVEIPFQKSGAVPTDASDQEYWRAWFTDPVLRLPAGTWEISASPRLSLSPSCATPGPDLRPTITLVVTP